MDTILRHTHNSQAQPSPGLTAPAKHQLQQVLSKQAQSCGRFLLLMLTLLPVVALWSLQSGAMGLNVAELLLSSNTNVAQSTFALHWNVLTEIRLPRLLMTLITGATLAMCGAVMQGICRNPLADPGLIGVSSGAALMAAVVLVFGPMLVVKTEWLPFLLPIAAFIGALLVSFVVFRMAQTVAGISTLLLILAGVALNALASTLLGLLSFIADDSTLRLITFWTMGSYAGVSWTEVIVVGLGGTLTGSLFWRHRVALTLIISGEQQARYLGVAVDRIKHYTLIGVAFATACAVSFTGIVGFVGLVTPHICRMLLGPDMRKLLPASALLGALLVACADTLARILVVPAEVPVGIVTSCLGIPFFIYLLLRQRRLGHA